MPRQTKHFTSLFTFCPRPNGPCCQKVTWHSVHIVPKESFSLWVDRSHYKSGGKRHLWKYIKWASGVSKLMFGRESPSPHITYKQGRIGPHAGLTRVSAICNFKLKSGRRSERLFTCSRAMSNARLIASPAGQTSPVIGTRPRRVRSFLAEDPSRSIEKSVSLSILPGATEASDKQVSLILFLWQKLPASVM